jgi:hypothetical protein
VKTKWNLTKAEQRTHSANAERLKSTGLAIAVEHAASSDPPLLRIEQSEYSEIYAGTRAGMALAISLRFTVLKSGITLRNDLEFTISGCYDAKVLLVPPPEGALSFRVLGWLDIERDTVLNHQIFSGRALPLDRNLDGLLVAQSFDLLPSQFQSGMSITGKIRFADLSGNVFTSDVRLGVERCKQSLPRPEEWPIRAGATYRHSSLAQDLELRGRDPKRMGGIALVKKGGPAVRSHL